MTFAEEAAQSNQISRIDSPLDRRRVGDMEVDKFAGLQIKEYRDAVEFCKLIAQAKNGLPPYLRGNGADCLIVCTQALRWRLEPVWVMQNSYVTKADGIITYNNFVFSAILMAARVLKGRPRYIYADEGDMRTCTISATFLGEERAHEYTTPPLKQCRKNSPLWKDDPDQQLGYFAIRSFGRRYIPELLGGVYAPDEFEDATQEAIPPSPRLMDRLPAKMQGTTGFQADVVDVGLAQASAEVQEAKAEAKAARKPRQSRQEPQDKPDAPPPAKTAAAPEAAPEPRQAPTAAQAEQMMRVVAAARDQEGGEPKPPPELPKDPLTAEEYVPYAEHWIAATTGPNELTGRWENEMDMRRELRVPVPVRKRLQTMVDHRFAELRRQRK